MRTTINYTDRYGKKRSKTFENTDSLLDHLSDEVQRLEIRRMTVDDKKEIRKLLKAEMSLLNILEKYSLLMPAIFAMVLTIMEQYIPGADVRSKTEIIETPEKNI